MGTTREQTRDVAAAARRITKARRKAQMIRAALERRRGRLGFGPSPMAAVVEVSGQVNDAFARLAAWEEEMAAYEGVAR